MRKYVSKLEGVDPERGDTMIFKWSDAIAQLADFPTPDKAGRVIQSFIRWGKGGTPETLTDAWENAVLQNMMEHQRSETHDYFRTCHNRERKEDGATYVETSVDKCRKAVNKTETEGNLNTKSNSSIPSGGIDKRGGQKPPVCNPLSVDDAKKIIKMLVPDSIASCGIRQPLRGTLEMQIGNDDENDLAEFMFSIIAALHPETEDDDEFEKLAKVFSDPLLEYLRQVAQPRKWNLALAKAYADAINPATMPGGKPIDDRDAFIMARMKKVTQALKTLNALDGKAKPNAPLPTEY